VKCANSNWNEDAALNNGNVERLLWGQAGEAVLKKDKLNKDITSALHK
jgi:hypothetical protein